MVNFPQEWVAGFTRNQWQFCSGMGGRFRQESTITPFTTLGDNVNIVNPLNLHGFSLVAHPFEAGNKIVFNFNIILRKDQTFLGVKVRNNFFLFKLEKDTI